MIIWRVNLAFDIFGNKSIYVFVYFHRVDVFIYASIFLFPVVNVEDGDVAAACAGCLF